MERIGDVLPGVLRGLGIARELEGWRAVGEWAEVAGPQIARRTRAVSFREGTLVVEVQGSSWRQELGYLGRDLKRRLNERMGAAVVRELQFTTTHGGIRR